MAMVIWSETCLKKTLSVMKTMTGVPLDVFVSYVNLFSLYKRNTILHKLYPSYEKTYKILSFTQDINRLDL